MRKSVTGMTCVCACVVVVFIAAAFAAPAKKATNKPATRPVGEIATSAAGASTVAIQPVRKKIAIIRLSGMIVEAAPDFSLFGDSTGYMTLRDWLERLAKARNDSSIDAVALEIRDPGMNWAQAQELADAVKRLNAVKPVYAYVTAASASEYLVASAAGDVAMEPAGELELVGLGIEMTYFRGTLDKLGIKPQMIQVGKFKGAAEPMTNTEPSKEVKEMYDWLLNDLYAQMCGQIAEYRNLKLQDVQAAIDAGPFIGKDALKYKLVDRLVGRLDWQDEILKKMKLTDADVDWRRDYGRKPRQSLDISSPLALLSLLTKESPAPRVEDPTIAIISGEGVIVSSAGTDLFSSEKQIVARVIIDAFESVRTNKNVKAVIFRINSPGGSALASEQIYQAVRKCAASKPVIVSISGMCASGGYYIAMGGRKIIADPAGIIGSIGVISGKFALVGDKGDAKNEGLMDKIGVSTYEITRGKNAGLFMSRSWNEREMGVMQRQAEQIYDLFVQRVSESRKDKIAKIEDVAQGRVFSARQAAQNGMIDEVGGMREALLAAQKAANLEGFHIIDLPRPKTLADLFSGNGTGDDTAALSPTDMRQSTEAMILQRFVSSLKAGPSLTYLLNMVQMMDRENVLTAMPFYFNVRR